MNTTPKVSYAILLSLILVLLLLTTGVLSYNNGYKIAKEGTEADLRSLQVKIDNLERTANVSPYKDPEERQIELIGKLAEGIKSASGSITVNGDGQSGNINIVFEYERK